MITGEGTEPLFEATEVSDLEVPPNFCMLTVDFSMREAPMVRR